MGKLPINCYLFVGPHCIPKPKKTLVWPSHTRPQIGGLKQALQGRSSPALGFQGGAPSYVCWFNPMTYGYDRLHGLNIYKLVYS